MEQEKATEDCVQLGYNTESTNYCVLPVQLANGGSSQDAFEEVISEAFGLNVWTR